MEFFKRWYNKGGLRRQIWYYWVSRKYVPTWTKRYWQRAYYEIVHGMKMEGWKGRNSGTILPATGKGKFVSVYTKGSYIDIVMECDRYSNSCTLNKGDFLRIIPCQYNHGIMVETWKDGKLWNRNGLDVDKLADWWRYTTNCDWAREEFEKKRPNKQTDLNDIA